MANLDIYLDIDRKDRVKGPTDSTHVPMPTFAQGNTLTFRVRALQPTGSAIGTIYNLVPNSGKTLQLAVGTKAGNASTHYVEQYTWSLNSDPLDPYFYADVNFNTTDVGTLIGSSAAASAYLEINLVDGGVPKTIFSQVVTIEASVIKNSTLTVLAGLTPASMEAVLALLQNITTKSVTIQSADGTHSRRLWEDNDGTPHDDQL